MTGTNVAPTHQIHSHSPAMYHTHFLFNWPISLQITPG